MGLQLTIESPDSVNLVMPPIDIKKKVSMVKIKSHTDIEVFLVLGLEKLIIKIYIIFHMHKKRGVFILKIRNILICKIYIVLFIMLVYILFVYI